MNMYIGENIKRLRREKNVTQEKLSEHLSISCQAISKWERGETYPDITLIIPIASYFGVSTDELLGVDHARNEQKILDCLAEYDRLSNLGKDKEKCDFIRKAYKEFPNDFRIINKHISMLMYDPYIEEYDRFQGLPTHIDETTRLCNRVVDECTEPNFRFEAMSFLIDIYEHQGNREKAIEMIEKFPKLSYWTKGVQYELFYSGMDDEKWWYWIRENLYDLADEVIVKIRNMASHSNSPPEERIKQFHKAVDFIKILHEDGDYGFRHFHLGGFYLQIACEYIKSGDYGKASQHMDMGFSHAKQYDELPDVPIYTSFLLRGFEFDRRKIYSGYESNTVKLELDYIDNDDFYDKIREMDWFKAVLDKYRPYAKKSKY